ncbi:NUDIX hydrolase [Ancylobacter sp. WKF20]|uniref:NUDIX hydrolase n=1 Tax=Ancylobacter sp. WKF20 TaxID=3039801 RepID=UPI0024344F8C|nr:NUDIX hydrolase [Ancylobacter sp. WKF20]WGD32104.1 NUDIX hydrolase [Ancylobacter sp. WKF20]
MAKSKQHNRQAKDGRVLQQVAALPYRLSSDGRLQILVLTSRETRRAVIPKGWPMKNHKDWKSAQIEAWQEAGIVGDVSRKKLGQYRYWKRLESHFALVKVSVFPLAVRRQLDDFPERGDRLHVWMSPEDAALLIDETDLGTLITAFAASAEWRKSARTHFPEVAAAPSLAPALATA